MSVSQQTNNAHGHDVYKQSNESIKLLYILQDHLPDTTHGMQHGTSCTGPGLCTGRFGQHSSGTGQTTPETTCAHLRTGEDIQYTRTHAPVSGRAEKP